MRRIKTLVVAAVIGVGTLSGIAALARCQPLLDDRIAKLGPDGKVQQLDGLVELTAIKQCVEVEPAARERLKAPVKEWLLDVQQQVIDNLDFIAEIEPLDGKPGVFETLDPSDTKKIDRINVYQRQLNGAGTLINMLEFKHQIEPRQAEALRRLVYDYDSAVRNEVATDNKDPMANARYQYRVAYRDAVGMYHRLLDRAAPKIDEAVASLKLPDDKAKAIAAEVAAVKAAKGTAEVRAAMKALLMKLPLIQQRNLLNKVRELTPITDPYSVL